MIKSLDELRKYVCSHTHENVSGPSNDFDNSARPLDVLTIADAIEREVEERYIELPKDADGMTVLPSDSMVDSNGEQFTVSSIELLASGDWLVYGSGRLGSKSAKLCHHHKSHTVEDVLEEMYDMLDDARIPNGSEKRSHEQIIAEYAQKLRLANNEE